MNNDLLRWRKEASKEEWALLAHRAMTTVGYLNQLAYGFRKASPSKALLIENASNEFSPRKPVSKENLVFDTRAEVRDAGFTKPEQKLNFQVHITGISKKIPLTNRRLIPTSKQQETKECMTQNRANVQL